MMAGGPSERQGLASIMLEPNSMVAEEYIARFTDDTPPEFVVATVGRRRAI